MAHVILVSAQGPNPSFFFFRGTFIQLGGLFGQGLGLGRGLDNYTKIGKLFYQAQKISCQPARNSTFKSDITDIQYQDVFIFNFDFGGKLEIKIPLRRGGCVIWNSVKRRVAA